jgi:hypothetical protein
MHHHPDVNPSTSTPHQIPTTRTPQLAALQVGARYVKDAFANFVLHPQGFCTAAIQCLTTPRYTAITLTNTCMVRLPHLLLCRSVLTL